MAAETETTIPNIDIKALEITPNECPLTDALSIKGNFSSDQSFDGKWKIVYIADSANNKHVINLGDTPCYKITKDTATNLIEFNVDSIDVSAINDAALFNVGILKLTLYECDTANNNKEIREVMDVNVVTQITQDSKDESKFIRTFFNPLEM